MGNISVVLKDVFSVFGNAAGIAAIDQRTFGCLYENNLLMPETGLGAVAIGIPVHSGTLGMKYSFYGYAGYSESQAGMTFGKKLGSLLMAGIDMTCVRICQVADYGNLFTIAPGIGMLFSTGDLVAAFQWFNPARQHFAGTTDEALSFFRVGAGYHLGREVFACVEAVKKTGDDEEYSVGIEWETNSLLTLRTGIYFRQYAQPAFGVGIHYPGMNMDLAVKHHPVAGYIMFLSFGWSWQQKQ